MVQLPLQDQPIESPSGRIVRLYNLLSLSQAPGPSFLRISPSFQIQYGTALSPEQSVERSEEAAEVIAYFLGSAHAGNIELATVEICDTRAQAEGREPPQAIYKFDRAEDGSWRPVGPRESRSRPSA
jgi:hypothetical protein